MAEGKRAPTYKMCVDGTDADGRLGRAAAGGLERHPWEAVREAESDLN